MTSAVETKSPALPGPHPSYIQVAKPFIFEQRIQGSIISLGGNPAREDSVRLQGVAWIDDVRRALQLPVRTYNTAVIYYHKFRLVHRDNEYQYGDAAAAALFLACKIEDTLKKSKEILCAAYNVKMPPSDYLTPDHHQLEVPSRTVIGLERLMLESSGFDYRNRYPQKYIIKIGVKVGLDKDLVQLGYNIMLDLYRTFAPLKQTSSTMAFACLKLATLLLNKQRENLVRDMKWKTSRQEVMETVLDLLDLYTHFQKSTIVGQKFPMDKYISIRIKLNGEADEKKIPRHTEWVNRKANGVKGSLIKTPKTPITPASPSDARLANGHHNPSATSVPAADMAISPGTLSPISSGGNRKAFGARGQEGTVRFMLDAEKAKKEKQCVAEYFKVEYEEYEVEVEEPIPPPSGPSNSGGAGHSVSSANSTPVGPANRHGHGHGRYGGRPNGPGGFGHKKARYR